MVYIIDFMFNLQSVCKRNVIKTHYRPLRTRVVFIYISYTALFFATFHLIFQRRSLRKFTATNKSAFFYDILTHFQAHRVFHEFNPASRTVDAGRNI